MKKIQYYTLRIFLALMTITAVLMLFAIWLPVEEATQGPNLIMQFVMTFFVIGLASFLIWGTTMILEIRNKLNQK